MTLGSGIFYSTVLLVAAAIVWQIALRHKWKLAGKVLGGAVAGIVLILVCYYAWLYVARLPPSPSVVTELVKIKLGMSPTDVSLELGKPDSVTNPSMEGSQTRFDFLYSDPEASVTFYGPDRYRAKAEIICVNQPFEKVLGFDNSNSEIDVTNRLGPPSSTSISSDGLSKIVSYPKWNIGFYISKGMISKKCLTSLGGLAFSQELLSPSQQKAADDKAAAQAQAVSAAQARIAAEETAKLAAQQPATRRPARQIIPERSETAGDPCAPNLTRPERLRRLANYGAIRQASEGEYTVGLHKVWYAAGSLITCE